MNSANYVDDMIIREKAAGKDPQEIAWYAALACTGWAYVFGARGQYCTPANRRARYSPEHETIKSKCQNFDGDKTCSGCKWYPGNQRTRFFDCRGFTYWVLKAVYGWELMGAGATTQWTNADNWKAKGTIDTVPEDVLVCLFVQKGSKMEHTGFGFRGETVECSSGVQHFTTRNKKWTHWGVPKCIGGEVPEPTPGTDKPTLRKGDKGEYVTLAQTELIRHGYSCGSSGADGKFGANTEKALKKFQQEHGLAADGVCGKKTWAKLDETEIEMYTVTIPHLAKYHAEALVSNYSGAWMTKEE